LRAQAGKATSDIIVIRIQLIFHFIFPLHPSIGLPFSFFLMRKKPIKAFTIKTEARTVCQPNDSAINETGEKTQKPPMGYTHGGFIDEFKDNPFHWINRLILVVC
jgi:hypothetical protein